MRVRVRVCVCVGGGVRLVGACNQRSPHYYSPLTWVGNPLPTPAPTCAPLPGAPKTLPGGLAKNKPRTEHTRRCHSIVAELETCVNAKCVRAKRGTEN